VVQCINAPASQGAKGVWSKHTCVKDQRCDRGKLPSVPNGKVQTPRGYNDFGIQFVENGEEFQTKCDSGFGESGDTSVVCENANWKLGTGSCVKKGEVRLQTYPVGRVGIFDGTKWGTLCGHFWWDNQKGAENLCKQMGYKTGFKYNATGGTGPIVAGNRLCSGWETTVYDCKLIHERTETQECTNDFDQGVHCSASDLKRGSVRLSSYPKGSVEIFNGTAKGRVEIFNGTEWGTLCGHFWWDNEKGAENLCKQLGYKTGVRFDAPEGTGSIVAGNRLCAGGEKTVYDCPLMQGRNDTHTCTNDNDQGVECSA